MQIIFSTVKYSAMFCTICEKYQLWLRAPSQTFIQQGTELSQGDSTSSPRGLIFRQKRDKRHHNQEFASTQECKSLIVTTFPPTRSQLVPDCWRHRMQYDDLNTMVSPLTRAFDRPHYSSSLDCDLSVIYFASYGASWPVTFISRLYLATPDT